MKALQQIRRFFHPKNAGIFLISWRKHMLWYSLEAPRRGASNEYPQHMFSSRNKKNITWIPPLICSYAKGVCSSYTLELVRNALSRHRALNNPIFLWRNKIKYLHSTNKHGTVMRSMEKQENYVCYHSGPSCSKLTTSLVNDSLKFWSRDTQICWNFLLKKCECKSYSHFFSKKYQNTVSWIR